MLLHGQVRNFPHWTEPPVKPLVIGVLVLFVGFWMVQAPDSLATFTRESGAWLWDTTTLVFESIMEFLGSLVG